MDRWHALGVRYEHGRRPTPGQLVALGHAVWRVISCNQIEPARWNDADTDWALQDEPWMSHEPIDVELEHIAGPNPLGVDGRGEPRKHGRWSCHANQHKGYWEVYPNGRWPSCSCCGDPMPCRAELADRAAESAMAQVAALEAKMPGCCWACDEPITARQTTVTYVGENLDLPGSPAPVFHTRRSCIGDAMRYEARWLAVDDHRARILTYPNCDGSLIVHHDGSTECHGGLDDCGGHLTHNHGSLRACYVQSLGCPRECPTEGHPGTRWSPRPRRQTEALTD